MNESQVINLIKQYSTVQGGTQGSFSVPLHWHRGSDAPQIYMGDLLNDFRGLIFTTQNKIGGGNYKINLVNEPNGFSQFYISPPVDNSGNPLGSFSLNGQDGEIYRDITFSSLLETSISAGDMTTSTNWLYQPGRTSIITSSPDFALNFPDITPLPATPLAGDLTFSSGHFYGCLVTGTWTLII